MKAREGISGRAAFNTKNSLHLISIRYEVVVRYTLESLPHSTSFGPAVSNVDHRAI